MVSPLRTCIISALLIVNSSYAAETHWSYSGEQGPAHWSEEGSPLCGSGHQQSPIDISAVHHGLSKANAHDLQINYGKSAVTLVNNGHTIQADMGLISNDWVLYRGKVFRLAQFHFHSPSEHTINHRSYPMEVHLVNKAADGSLLVIGLMIAEGKQNAELSDLMQALPSTAGLKKRLDRRNSPDLEKLLPAQSHHYYYKGSLTTPPCSEGVQWVLFDTPVELPKEQIDHFKRLIGDNHRPLQLPEGRVVEED